METESRKHIKPSFDPQLIANFHKFWGNIHEPTTSYPATTLSLAANRTDFFYYNYSLDYKKACKTSLG